MPGPEITHYKHRALSLPARRCRLREALGLQPVHTCRACSRVCNSSTPYPADLPLAALQQGVASPSVSRALSETF